MVRKRSLPIVALLLLSLVGCAFGVFSNSTYDSFQLTQIGVGIVEATPTDYVVSPEEYPGSILLVVPKRIDNAIAHDQVVYDLEEVTVTNEEIILKFNGEESTFRHLDEDIYQAQNGVQYQFLTEHID